MYNLRITKKITILFAAFLFVGCIQHKIDDLNLENTQNPTINSLDVTVTKDFDWSLINISSLEIDVKYNGNSTNALNGTIIELFDQDDELLDALTVYDGTATFNVRIPTATTKLKIRSEAVNISKEFPPNKSQVDFNIPNLEALAFNKTDTDNDGLFDIFDAFPNDPKKTISINPPITNPSLKSANARSTSNSNYTIFEDLWPSTGDYDFNDLVVKADFSWDRGKSNYITEITAVIKIENIGAGLGLGLGYELFEVKGVNLTYLADIITGVSGSGLKDEMVRNGIIVFNKAQSTGLTELTLSITLKDKQIKDFLFIPYLFRSDDTRHQVRPFGAPPTANQNMALFNTDNDYSPQTWNFDVGHRFKYPLTSDEAFYKTKENHPWGIEFISKSKFKASKENTSIIKSYPGFKSWAESGGSTNNTWYENPLQ